MAQDIEFEIQESVLADLNSSQISILRSMTLPYKDSMMRRTLRESRFDRAIKVGIAKRHNTYVGWAMIKYYRNNRLFIMIYVRPEHRRQGIGTALAKHFSKKGVHFCYRWDTISNRFYDSVGLYNVFK